jgi:hypothetical protein
MAEEKSSTVVIVKEATAETAREVAVEKSPETSEAVQIDNQAMENSKEASSVVQADAKVSEAAETIQAEAKISAKISEVAGAIQADIITSKNTPEIAESMKAAENPANKDDNALSSVTDRRKNQQIMVGPSAAGFEEKVAHLENMLRGVYAVAAEAGTEDAKEDAKEDAPAFEDAHPMGKSQEPVIEVINLP